MTGITISKAEIETLDPCYPQWDLLKDKLPEQITADVAVEAGASFDDLLWMLTESGKHDKILHLFAADCAAHVLHIYEETESGDASRKAIIARRAFARGEITPKEWQVAQAAALAFALAVAQDAALAAALTAAQAVAFASALAAAQDAAQDAAQHAAQDAALAAALAAGEAAAQDAAEDAAWAAERKWQLQRLVDRLNNPNIPDWPLPEEKA